MQDLTDYAELMIAGHVPKEEWKAICSACDTVIDAFHEHGMIHGDLHAGNLVVTLSEGEWKATLIDFSFSSLSDEAEVAKTLERLESLNVRLNDLDAYSQAADRDRLNESLTGLTRESSKDFLAGIAKLL